MPINQLHQLLTDLVGMHIVFTGQLIDRLQPFDGFEGKLEFELSPISFSFLGQFTPPRAW